MLKLFIFLMLEIVHGELLVWSLKELHCSALKHYNTDDFRGILRELGNPEIAVFDNVFPSREFAQQNSAKYKTTFLLNADVNFEDFDVIAHNSNIEDILLMNEDVLIVFQQKHSRIKRNVANEVNDNTSTSVLFADNGIMIYSKSYPELKRDTTTILLSQCSSITSQSSSKQASTITIEFFVSDQTTVGLIFYFALRRTTWVLDGTKLNDAAGDIILKPSMKIFAPMDYSFHCNEVIKFRDVENDIEVKFYSMQVQPYSNYLRVFYPAVDCAPFFTVPILCFLLVIAVFLFGVFLGLAALASIKPIRICDPARVKKFNIKYD